MAWQEISDRVVEILICGRVEILAVQDAVSSRYKPTRVTSWEEGGVMRGVLSRSGAYLLLLGWCPNNGAKT